ncbi:FAD-binding protein [Burkholderiaceae bacterium DAT-1]|nr:FAD-binding protein [Burkholderiaceae bacterium DAT-1]
MSRLPEQPQMPRRQFLQSATAIAAASLLPGCGQQGTEPQSPVPFTPGKPLPWVNWAGNQSCLPAFRAAPASEDELVSVLKSAKGCIRVVGASHSFSAVVPTSDTLVATDLLSGVISSKADTLETEIWAGTRMHALGPMLAAIGQALPNQPDMDYPAMGGAIACSVHATGSTFGSMSSYVTGLTLATPTGELIECSTTQHPEIFQAARVSLGALGIVSRIRLQNERAFDLTEINAVEKTEDVLDDFEARCKQHRHFEFMPLPHTSMSATIATDLAKPGDASSGTDDPQAVNTLRKVFQGTAWIPGLGEAAYEKILTMALGGEANQVRTGKSYEVFPHVRVVRFREMEYTVPAEHGPACVREILKTIRDKKLPICFPLEVRRVKADDIWLSMFEGRDGCSISVHQFGDIDFRPYFAAIEPIFWKYEGRPHWGKIHTLTHQQLAALYPRHWQDFQAVRQSLDPHGRMLNAHLKTLFGA